MNVYPDPGINDPDIGLSEGQRLPSAEAGSGDHVSPTAVFPSLSVLAKK